MLDENNKYDYTRVIVSEKVREIEKKKEQINSNMNSLTFHVKYKEQSVATKDKLKESHSNNGLARNLISETTGLKLPEILSSKAQKMA